MGGKVIPQGMPETPCWRELCRCRERAPLSRFAVVVTGWIAARLEKSCTFHQAVYRIQLQKRHGRAAFSRYAIDVDSVEPEVYGPGVCPGIKEWYERPCQGIEGAEITRLPSIAHGARQREIFQHRLTAVFFRDHMIHLMGRGRKLLGQQAVFTAIARPRDNLSAEFC